MTDKTLSYVLRNIDLLKCTHLRDNIFYTRQIVTQHSYNFETSLDNPIYTECEFLIIADDGTKKAIIYNCNNEDLHWYVFSKWRGKQVLSTALRTGIIHDIWPAIKSVTCCYYSWENKLKKYELTRHLAALAGLGIREGRTCWTS